MVEMSSSADLINKADLVDTDYIPTNGMDMQVHPRTPSKTLQTVSFSKQSIEARSLNVPSFVRSDLERISQLGLKELWLGTTPKEHTRWKHSVRTLNASRIWMQVLMETSRVPEHCFPSDGISWDQLSYLVDYAALLHDYGHLPFSHLVAEAFETVNWLPADAKWGGLEIPVLHAKFDSLGVIWGHLAAITGLDQDTARKACESLIIGDYGLPWVQTVVNSAIDADKIDYIRFDSKLLHESHFPVSARIQHSERPNWLEEFLQEQEVNHAGILCLHGASARSAADLWEDRIFLYDRFYLSPYMRVPERMALELLQQCLIRATMSEQFANALQVRANLSFEFANSVLSGFNGSHAPRNPIDLKFRRAHAIMVELAKLADGSRLEFKILTAAHDVLQGWKAFDGLQKELWKRCYDLLLGLCPEHGPIRDENSLRTVVNSSLVQQPMLIGRASFDRAREVLRPIQHAYSREALIDLVRLPKVLAAPRRYKGAGRRIAAEELGHPILVPEGPPSSWVSRKRACRVLTDEIVTELDRPYCRIILICPQRADSAQAKYIWDRVRTTLIEADITVLVEDVGGQDGIG